MKKNKNDVLKKYITEKYGCASKFLKKENFPQEHLELMLVKKEIFHGMGVGIKICGFLNIDAVKLFCENEIAAIESIEKKNADTKPSLDDIIKEKYAKLDGEKQKKVIEYANYIFDSVLDNEENKDM